MNSKFSAVKSNVFRGGKITICILCAVFIILVALITISIIVINIVPNNNILDLTSQMEQTEKEELSKSISEFTGHKSIDFFLSYHAEDFNVTEEYIENVKNTRDNKIDILYVYMRESGKLQKVQDDKIVELGIVDSDAQLSDMILLDMAKTEPSRISEVVKAIFDVCLVCMAIFVMIKLSTILKHFISKKQENHIITE